MEKGWEAACIWSNGKDGDSWIHVQIICVFLIMFTLICNYYEYILSRYALIYNMKLQHMNDFFLWITFVTSSVTHVFKATYSVCDL